MFSSPARSAIVRATLRTRLTARMERLYLSQALPISSRQASSSGQKGRFYVQFNLDGLMRGDYKSRMEGYAIARQNGWMSANDIRELENLNPLSDEDGGNVYLVNGTMIPVNVSGLAQVVKAVTAVDPAAGEPTQTDQPQEQKEDDSA